MKMWWPFKRKASPPTKPKGWPWSHREWEGVEIPGAGTVVGWDAQVPRRFLCLNAKGEFVNYDLPDYKPADLPV